MPRSPPRSAAAKPPERYPHRGRRGAIRTDAQGVTAHVLRWTKRSKTSNALAQRARIILRCAEGADEVPNSVVARELGVTDATVGKWRSRYIAHGLAGLLDEERC